jgi:hypothetical protein
MPSTARSGGGALEREGAGPQGPCPPGAWEAPEGEQCVFAARVLAHANTVCALCGERHPQGWGFVRGIGEPEAGGEMNLDQLEVACLVDRFQAAVSSQLAVDGLGVRSDRAGGNAQLIGDFRR